MSSAAIPSPTRSESFYQTTTPRRNRRTNRGRGTTPGRDQQAEKWAAIVDNRLPSECAWAATGVEAVFLSPTIIKLSTTSNILTHSNSNTWSTAPNRTTQTTTHRDTTRIEIRILDVIIQMLG